VLIYSLHRQTGQQKAIMKLSTITINRYKKMQEVQPLLEKAGNRYRFNQIDRCTVSWFSREQRWRNAVG